MDAGLGYITVRPLWLWSEDEPLRRVSTTQGGGAGAVTSDPSISFTPRSTSVHEDQEDVHVTAEPQCWNDAVYI